MRHYCHVTDHVTNSLYVSEMEEWVVMSLFYPYHVHDLFPFLVVCYHGDARRSSHSCQGPFKLTNKHQINTYLYKLNNN